MKQTRNILHRSRWAIVPLALATIGSVGCLGEPEIDERWTLIEFTSMSPSPQGSATAGQSLDVSVRGRITYRQILTGFLVAEIRYSPTVTPASVALHPDVHNLQNAQDVDRILANSVTAGRATRAVTGWDHLMQEIPLSFTAQIPDSAANGGIYLLLYMGEGDEIRLEDGSDSLVVTPFVSSDYEVLHTGYALGIASAGGGSPP